METLQTKAAQGGIGANLTCRAAIPVILRSAGGEGAAGLFVEMTDGTAEANAEFRRNVGFYYDLVKANVERIVERASGRARARTGGGRRVTPGWLRSERMLENFGVTEANWQDACRDRPSFAISESRTYVARGVAALASGRSDAKRWAGSIVSARQLADAYEITDTDGSRPDCWGHHAAYGWEQHDGHGIDEAGRMLDERTVAVGSDELLGWAAALDAERLWALEDLQAVDAAGWSGNCFAGGEELVRVSPKLTVPERRAGRTRGKSDPIDALAVARAALREPDLPRPQPGERVYREIKLLVDHRDDLVDERRRTQQRLRWHLHELDPTFVVPLRRLAPGEPAGAGRPLAGTA